MKKNLYRCLAVTMVMALLLAGCSTQPAQETQTTSDTQNTAETQTTQPAQSPTATASPTAEPIPPENILFIACEGSEESFFPIMPFILTMDYNTNSIRFTNFYLSTQIDAVTKKGDKISMPMTFLNQCDTEEIVKAYENTYGIKIDRYIIFKYDNKKTIEILSELGPIKLFIPEEFLGDKEYTTINGNMEHYGKSLDMEPKPVDESGEQELDSLGLFSFFHTIPERVWESDDRFTNMMEDYRLWDEKNQTVIAALKPLLKLLGEDKVSGLWKLVAQGQDTNITDEDIAKWSKLLVNLPAEKTPYFTVPGFEDVEFADFDAKALTGISGYDVKMLTYDNEKMAEDLQKFINAE